uniref:Uncharacterized protein n=1 Tax=Octopus bimaculoides TaxID=37653 RepID=A0A0L8GX08_OCTBM
MDTCVGIIRLGTMMKLIVVAAEVLVVSVFPKLKAGQMTSPHYLHIVKYDTVFLTPESFLLVLPR